MRRILKAPLEFQHDDPVCEVTLPEGSQIVRLDLQPGTGSLCAEAMMLPTLWALGDDDNASETRRFTVYDTGAPVARHSQYVGTFTRPRGVWHLFELIGEPLPDGLVLPANAEAAYRTMTSAGFTVREVRNDPRQKVPLRAWVAPDDEPLTTELMMAVATLQEHGFGPVVSR